MTYICANRHLAYDFGQDQAAYDFAESSPETCMWELENAAYSVWTWKERRVDFPNFSTTIEGYVDELEGLIAASDEPFGVAT